MYRGVGDRRDEGPRPDLDTEALERGAETLGELTRSARAQQVSGVPNFMLGEWPFGGIQTEDTMRKILTRYATKRRRGEVK